LRYLAACLLLGCAAALAQSSALTAADAWVRVTPGVDVAAAYLTLHNGGARAVTITAVSSPLASSAMIHETRMVNGESSMRPHEQLHLAPGETVRLAPGGLHIMLHLKAPTLQPGQDVPLTLRLQDGTTVGVAARVRPLGEG
jgi:periplasmic copper chaperone A